MWSNVIIDGDSPQGRSKHAIVLVKHDLYLYGGKSGSSYLKDFWKLELREGRWSRIKGRNSPPPLQEHTMVHYQDRIYLFGGEIGIGENTPLWIYDIKRMEWRKWKGDAKIKSPGGSRGHVAAIHSGYMLIHGGYRDLKGSLGDIWAFHFETESWHIFYQHQSPAWYNSLPAARHSHAGIMHGGSLFIYGGMSDLEEKGDFWKFDIESQCWIQLKYKPNPGPVVGPLMTKAFGSVFLFGGDRNGRPSDDLWRFSFCSDTWEKFSFHGVKPTACLYPAVAMLPAIVKVKSKSKSNGLSQPTRKDEDGSYWWDNTAHDVRVTATTQVAALLRRMSNGHYEMLESGTDEECGTEEEWTNGDGSQGDLDDLPLSPPQNPKRSETTTCFRAAAHGHQRVQKSNSVRFSDFQAMPNSTSDYASMETLEDARRNCFENPNYNTPPEMIEMETLSGGGCGPGRADIEITTPNYLLVIGGQESAHSHIPKQPIRIWRLRVAKELLET